MTKYFVSVKTSLLLSFIFELPVINPITQCSQHKISLNPNKILKNPPFESFENPSLQFGVSLDLKCVIILQVSETIREVKLLVSCYHPTCNIHALISW